MKSGFVAIIGKPNAGKSTLINALVNAKIAITSPKAQTTRNSILGILNSKDYQIVFIDTPGVHKPSTHLGTYMVKEAMNQALGADVIFYLVDANAGVRNEDKEILDRLFKENENIFLLVNKIDEISKDKLIERLAYASKLYDFKEIIPISALKKENLDDLLDTLLKYLTDSVKYYPDDVLTPNTINFNISEIIREKLLINLNEEIPHLLAVNIDEYSEEENKVNIEASIIVNKESHKAIVIGKSGNMLKKIKGDASSDIRKLLNKKVYLSLFVKLEEDWLNKDTKLFDLGYFIEK